MVQVRRSRRQIQRQALRGIETDLRVTPEQLGAGVGRGLRQLAGDISQIAQREESALARENQRQETSALNEANTALSKAEVGILQGDNDQEGFLAQKPINGNIASESHIQALEGREKKVQEIAAGIKNEAVRARFLESAERTGVSYRSTVQRKSNQNFSRISINNLNTAVAATRSKAIAVRDNPSDVIASLRQIDLAYETYGAENDLPQDEVNKLIESEVEVTYKGVILKLLEERRPEDALAYIEDDAKGFVDQDTLNQYKDEADKQIFLKGTNAEVIQLVGEQREARGFSEASLENERQKAADRFGNEVLPDGTRKVDVYNKTLDAAWRTEQNRKRRLDIERMQQFSDNVQGSTRLDAQTQAAQLPADLQGAANSWIDKQTFAGDPPAPTEAEAALASRELMQEIRNSIQQDQIRSPQQLNLLFGEKLSKGDFNRLAAMFDSGAEGQRQKELNTMIKGAVAKLSPGATSRERTKQVGELYDFVEDILGGTDPTPDKVESIIKTLRMNVAVVDPITREFQTAIIGTGLDDIQERAEEFGSIIPLALEPQEKKEVEEQMRASGLDPEKLDPREYARTVRDGLPILGQRRFGVPERTRASRFVRQQSFNVASEANTDLMLQDIRNSMTGFVYTAPNGATLSGSKGMFLDLEDHAKQVKTPEWLRRGLESQGKIRDASGNEVEALDLYLNALRAQRTGEARSKFISDTGKLFLERALQ